MLDRSLLTDHMIDINLVYINNDTFERLPSQHRQALLEAHQEAAMEVRRISEELQESLVQRLRELGMQVITPEDGLDIEAFRRAVTAHVERRFPGWAPYVEQIRAVASDGSEP